MSYMWKWFSGLLTFLVPKYSENPNLVPNVIIGVILSATFRFCSNVVLQWNAVTSFHQNKGHPSNFPPKPYRRLATPNIDGCGGSCWWRKKCSGCLGGGVGERRERECAEREVGRWRREMSCHSSSNVHATASWRLPVHGNLFREFWLVNMKVRYVLFWKD